MTSGSRPRRPSLLSPHPIERDHMSSPSIPARISSELNQADPGDVIALASQCLADDPDVTVTKPPQVGVVVAQVREPVAEQRFLLGDVMASQAEVRRRGVYGWAMRLGSDTLATLGAAVLAAEYTADGPPPHRDRRARRPHGAAASRTARCRMGAPRPVHRRIRGGPVTATVPTPVLSPVADRHELAHAHRPELRCVAAGLPPDHGSVLPSGHDPPPAGHGPASVPAPVARPWSSRCWPSRTS